MIKQLSISIVFDYPYSLNRFSFFEIGQNKEFINFQETKDKFTLDYKNRFRYQLENLVELTTTYKTPLSVYFSGVFLKLLEVVDTDMLKKLNDAVNSNLELLTGSYTNSLSPIFSLKSAIEEIKEHNNYLESLFSKGSNKCYLFENIYSNEICKQLNKLGIETSFAGAISWYLNEEKSSRILRAQCSDDYAVVLPDQDYNSVFNNLDQENHFIQLDISSLQRLGSIKSIIEKLRRKSSIVSINEQVSSTELGKKYNIKTPVMSGLLGINLDTIKSNALQNSSIRHYYLLKEKVLKTSDQNLITSWKLLGHSDYFVRMGVDCRSAYDFYSNYMNIINDLEIRLDS